MVNCCCYRYFIPEGIIDLFKLVVMKKYVLAISLLLLFINFGCYQKKQNETVDSMRIKNMISEIKFIDYYDAIDDLTLSDSLNEDILSSDEYQNILFLDTMDIDEVEKVYPQIVQDFRIDFDFLDYSEIDKNSRVSRMKFIETDLKSLEDCFKDEKILEEILSNNFGHVQLSKIWIEKEIYLKDDKVAVFTIKGIGSECNKIWKVDGGLYIEPIYSIST